MENKIVSILFCLLLLSGLVIGIATPDKDYSASEKRQLQQLPSISADKIFSGELSTDIEKYLADQFPARDSWVTLKTVSEIALGKKEISGVYFAKDSYLIDKTDVTVNEQVKSNISALVKLSDKLKQDGINMKVMLVPTSDQILSDKLPAFATVCEQHKVIEYAKSQGLDTVDVTDILKSHNSEYIYYKTDHHYTSLGAYYCYSQWKSDKGLTASPLSSWKSETLCDNFRGTTYSKVNYPFAPYDTITSYYKSLYHKVDYNNGAYVTDSIYERKYLDTTDQYAVFFNSNQQTTVINGNGNGKLLILKDSYANIFSQFAVDEYNETHMIDPRFFRSSISKYISDNGITEVLVLYNISGFAADKNVAKIS